MVAIIADYHIPHYLVTSVTHKIDEPETHIANSITSMTETRRWQSTDV